MYDQTEPGAAGITADAVSLNLGQTELDAFDDWSFPPGYDGPERSPRKKTTVHDGTPYDPPLVTVAVTAGMVFHDTQAERYVTVDKVLWHAYRSDATLDYVDPSDPVDVCFVERETPEDPDSPRFDLTAATLGWRIRSGRYVRALEREADAAAAGVRVDE